MTKELSKEPSDVGTITVRLPRELIIGAKVYAAQNQKTLGKFVDDALTFYIENDIYLYGNSPKKKPHFPIRKLTKRG